MAKRSSKTVAVLAAVLASSSFAACGGEDGSSAERSGATAQGDRATLEAEKQQRGPRDPIASDRDISQGDCRIAGDKPLADSESAPLKRPYPYQEWLANPEAQEGVSLVNAAMRARFGAPGGAKDPLRSGLIGIAIDHHAQEMVVVVDPSRVDERTVEDEAQSAAEGTPLQVRGGPACHSAAELLDARAVIEDRDWHPGASTATYAWNLAAKTGTFHLIFSDEDRNEAKALKARLGDTVTIKFSGTVGRE